jgi:adenosine deaminase
MQDVYDIAYHSVKQFTNDGIFYIEMRFSPEHFALQNNFDRLEVAQTVIEASNKAAQEEGFYIKYLITLNRGKQVAEEMIELYQSIKNASPDIVGYDLAGDETNFPPENFEPFFELINKDGKYKATIHAGEVTLPPRFGPPSTTSMPAGLATEQAPSRMRNSKRSSLTDRFLWNSASQATIKPVLGETSPRIQRGFVQTGRPDFLGSDDPTIQNADLTDDYLLAQKHFDLNSEDFRKINLIGLNNSFLDEKTKTKLLKEYEAKVKPFL